MGTGEEQLNILMPEVSRNKEYPFPLNILIIPNFVQLQGLLGTFLLEIMAL